MWAKPLGGNIYQIRNTPFFAYGLNFMDSVLAVPECEDERPEIQSVFERSGHLTLRVFFDKSVPVPERIPMMESLNILKAYFEQMSDTFFALDVEPERSYSEVRSKLDAWVDQRLLDYETCEARIEGSFDDIPQIDETLDEDQT